MNVRKRCVLLGVMLCLSLHLVAYPGSHALPAGSSEWPGWGGPHRNFTAVCESIKEALSRHLKELTAIPIEKILDTRYEKYRSIGVWTEANLAQIQGKPKKTRTTKKKPAE